MYAEIVSLPPEREGRIHRISSLRNSSGLNLFQDVRIIDVYRIDLEDPSLQSRDLLLYDPVAQSILWNSHWADQRDFFPWDLLLEITYKPGVTNPQAITLKQTLERFLNRPLDDSVRIQTACQYLFSLSSPTEDSVSVLTNLLHNPLIESATVISKRDWDSGRRTPLFYPRVHTASVSNLQKTYPVAEMETEDLTALSEERLLALSPEELLAIKGYYQSRETIEKRNSLGLTEEATEAELEMIAQTWSEHCKHKIFQARIHYQEKGKTTVIDSLFDTFIKRTTELLSKEKDYLKSVFTDNSGVIAFDEENLLCFKAETHNSPSALDPYGGAITGIVGVNRDILGTGLGAKPIFNTNVLCFAFPDTKTKDVPAGIIHPKRLMEGVHRGIIDGGNQSGIPVVAGAFHFDESYLGKPLVFCGTGGILPAQLGDQKGWTKKIEPGDLAVMVGGRIGKDGIHGATFSSLSLDETSPVSAVQIGDPITQKKMLDFLIEARDQGLYKGITDNGAGGLSSSLGEMAQTCGGVKINLSDCPLKYSGLEPWEILVSESQERMSLSVSWETLEPLEALARDRDVEVTVVGEFTNSGYIEAYYHDKPVLLLSLDFLHKGVPKMDLSAVWMPRPEGRYKLDSSQPLKEALFRILEDPVVASKEPLVRQYDHEVLAQSVIKPFLGADQDAPSDGAVLRPVYSSSRGITITHGICPRYGDYDPYNMAMAAVDEAYRSHIALGGNPDQVSALDNFCWPDPIKSTTNQDGDLKLAGLVRTCQGLMKACLEYGIPLISGKDSMKNDAVIAGKRISVRPTLLISLMGIIDDVSKAISTDFKKAGDVIFLLGTTRGELGGTIYERLFIKESFKESSPVVYTEESIPLYKSLHRAINQGLISSAHDLSDGGLAVAFFESALGGNLGGCLDLAKILSPLREREPQRLLFSESPSRFLVSAPSKNSEALLACFSGLSIAKLGITTEEPVIRITAGKKELAVIPLEEAERKWKREW